jgi:hypothetical protein
MLSLIGLIPEERAGVVILTNYSKHNLHLPLFYRIADALLGQPPRDWSAEFLEAQKKSEARLAEAMKKVEQTRVPGTHPTLSLDAYAGVYEDDLYGAVQVSEQGDHLVVRYSSHLTADLQHWHYDTFRLTWRDPAMQSIMSGGGDHNTAFVTFVMDARGKVTEMKLGDLATFKRAPEPRIGPGKEGETHG